MRSASLGESVQTIDALHKVWFAESLHLLADVERQSGHERTACETFRRSAAVLTKLSADELSPPAVSQLDDARRELATGLAACSAP
jgi:hypothetical protein